MLDKDFDWCFNHENLFREWLNLIYKRIDYYDMDNATIFDLWQEAKKYALEIANAKKPDLYFKIIINDLITNFNHHSFLLWNFLCTMLTSSKNKNLELYAYCGNKMFKEYLSEEKIDENSIDELDNISLVVFNIKMLSSGQIESDYDYSLPDGGIKDETETDETPQLEETAENNETLLKELTPIFYGNKEQAEDYIKKIKNKTKDVQIVRYTAQLVNENTISEMSCHRDLYRILYDHGLYTKSESNWNKVINQYLVKK